MSEDFQEPGEASCLDESTAASTMSPVTNSTAYAGDENNIPIHQSELSKIPSFRKPRQESNVQNFEAVSAEEYEEADTASTFRMQKLLNAQGREETACSSKDEKMINIYGLLEPFESNRLPLHSQLEVDAKNKDGAIEHKEQPFNFYSMPQLETSGKTMNNQSQDNNRAMAVSKNRSEDEPLPNATPPSAPTIFQKVMDIYKPLEPFEENETPAPLCSKESVKEFRKSLNFSTLKKEENYDDEQNDQIGTESPGLNCDPISGKYKSINPSKGNEDADRKPFDYYSLPFQDDKPKEPKKTIDLYEPSKPFEDSGTASRFYEQKEIEEISSQHSNSTVAHYIEALEGRDKTDRARDDEEKDKGKTSTNCDSPPSDQNTQIHQSPHRSRSFLRSKSLPADERTVGDGDQPGAFYVSGRAEGELPSWTQEESYETNLRELPRFNSAPTVVTPTFTEQTDTSTVQQIPDPPPQPPRLPNNASPLETEMPISKAKKRREVSVVIIAFVLVAGVAIGIGLGLGAGTKTSITNLYEDEEKDDCFIGAAEFSQDWKECLCDQNLANLPEVYAEKYEDIQTSLKAHVESLPQNASSCDPIDVALLWLTEDRIDTLILPNDTSLLRRFVLALCFFSWYDQSKPWKEMSGWMTSENECEWYNVTCNEDDEIVSIWLLINQLSGPIPTQLGLLSRLSKLVLGTNGITGTIPTEIGQLEHLKHLNLAQNEISGNIPSEVARLTLLENIHLNENKIGGTIPIELGQLKSLQNLFLHFNRLTGSIPSELGHLINLEEIQVSYNDELKGSIPTTIGSCTSLKKIYLDSCDFTGTIPSEIGQLSNLQWFSSTFASLSGSIPDTFAHVTQLQSLFLANNKLTGTLSPTLGLNNTLLEKIRLSSNYISGSIPTEIGLLTHLEVIELRETNIQGSIPSQMGLCLNLSLIEISYNRELEGTIPLDFGNLSKLTTFNFAATKLEGTVPDEICSLPKLHTMHADCRPPLGEIKCDCCTTCF
eukprot:CAMPEP_0178937246 /NCGR_PEP_ID=MMETSP0786-20121207/25641_1 /TAXON_ID=186022 /ORGANISM="Thalassionema frauenfeldii, Strain CCMP 1798" /LENGTH=996 /DNA_ID=CAMNT_0020615777 /DNA_START=312 /DNA_END=3302 /DNA_ORIENTATION=+